MQSSRLLLILNAKNILNLEMFNVYFIAEYIITSILHKTTEAEVRVHNRNKMESFIYRPGYKKITLLSPIHGSKFVISTARSSHFANFFPVLFAVYITTEGALCSCTVQPRQCFSHTEPSLCQHLQLISPVLAQPNEVELYAGSQIAPLFRPGRPGIGWERPLMGSDRVPAVLSAIPEQDLLCPARRNGPELWIAHMGRFTVLRWV